jgi:preprotein translocase subunit SecE
MQGLIRYINGSIEELKRVVWPTRKKALTLTAIVLSFTVILAIYLTGLDLIFRTALEKLLSL